VNRRDFLTLKTRDRSAVVSCEQLYMRYVDAQAEGTTRQLFEQLAGDLRDVASVRLTETAWLTCEDLKRRLDQVLMSRSIG
jgi:hypothetical protein